MAAFSAFSIGVNAFVYYLEHSVDSNKVPFCKYSLQCSFR